MPTIPSGPIEGTPLGPVDLAQSIAGEEDPGASIDLSIEAGSPARSDQPAGRRADEPTGAPPPMSPGDEAPVGTPGTGEDVCPSCGGTGRIGGQTCPECEGTGKVNVGIGGA